MNRWVLHFDGLCEPRNPGGWMCWGWTLEREGEQTITGQGSQAPAPSNTNNIAEYLACGWGIRAAIELKKSGAEYPGLIVHGDSQLVINQLNKRWQCHKAHLMQLRDRCLVLLTELGNWEAIWVARELNSDTDDLSRQAYIKATGKAPPVRH